MVVYVIRFTKTSQMLSCRILSKESLDAIHYATLEVLEKTGVVVESEKALKILEEAGCTVDYRKHLALIPPHVVKEALMRKPKNVTLYARNPKNDVRLDGRHIFFCTDGSGAHTLDPKTGVRKASTKKDLSMSARIADYLDAVGVYWPMITSQDVPAPC